MQLRGDRIDLLHVGRASTLPSARMRSSTPNVSSGGDQRLGKLDLRIVHLVAMLVADAQDVAKALGDQQRGGRPLALDQRVGDDGGGVHDDAVDVARREPGGCAAPRARR